MNILRRSPIDNKMHTCGIDIDPQAYLEGLKAWKAGALIQEAFPQLSADDREFIMTGVTPEQWDEVFPDE